MRVKVNNLAEDGGYDSPLELCHVAEFLYGGDGIRVDRTCGVAPGAECFDPSSAEDANKRLGHLSTVANENVPPTELSHEV